LENLAQEGSLITTTDGADVGYFIQGRTITNLDGLIYGVEYFEHLQNFTANRYLDTIGMDYIFVRPYVILQSDPYQRMFAELLSPIAVIGDMTLYRYLPSCSRLILGVGFFKQYCILKREKYIFSSEITKKQQAIGHDGNQMEHSSV
jgi:hypothetical protein